MENHNPYASIPNENLFLQIDKEETFFVKFWELDSNCWQNSIHYLGEACWVPKMKWDFRSWSFQSKISQKKWVKAPCPYVRIYLAEDVYQKSLNEK